MLAVWLERVLVAGRSPTWTAEGPTRLEAPSGDHTKASLTAGLPKPSRVSTTSCVTGQLLLALFLVSLKGPEGVSGAPLPRGPGTRAVIFTVSRKHWGPDSVSPKPLRAWVLVSETRPSPLATGSVTGLRTAPKTHDMVANSYQLRYI